jgi:hypothetical protein
LGLFYLYRAWKPCSHWRNVELKKNSDITKCRIVPAMEKNFPNGDGILQHEYAPCYTSKKVKKVIEELKIKYDSVLWELP